VQQDEISHRGTETRSKFFRGFLLRFPWGERPKRNLFSVPLCLCGILLFSCGKEPPPAPPPPKAPLQPEPDLPPVADVSFPDWAEVDEGKFLELPRPAEAPVLRWDFSPGRRFGYEAVQTITQRIENHKGAQSGTMQARDRNRGTFEFIAGQDRTAIVLIRIHTEEAFRNDVQASREEIAKSPATKIEAAAKEDGTAEIRKPPGRDDYLFFFDALLALVDGERKLKDGWVRTRVAGFAKVERYECVRLESEFEFTPKIPLGATLMRGRTIAWFALHERRFVRASSVIATSTRSKTKDQDGAWIVSKTDSSTILRLKLLENP